jgi:peroxiredoxin
MGRYALGMRADLVPGAPFPDLRLPDWQGNMQSLSVIQGEDPMVVVFYRGLF